MPLPNFFVIGAPKSGTTALYHSLVQHPDIYMSPVKEPCFFAFEAEPPINPGPGGALLRNFCVWQAQNYLHLFSGATKERAIGEASTIYLRSSLAAQRISRNIPQSKLIAILRHPAERAYSSYCFHVRNGIEWAPTFNAALRHEKIGLRSCWFSGLQHQADGYYHAQLAVYYALFPREQIKVYLHDEFIRTPQVVLRDLFRFLEVDDKVAPRVERKNVTLVPKHRRFHRLAQQLAGVEHRLAPLLPARARRSAISGLQRLDRNYNMVPPPPLDPRIRGQLTAEYRDDTLRLQDLIDRDLSHWLEPPSSPPKGKGR